MTQKQKAKELVDKYLNIDGSDDCGNSYSYVATQCALICVDESIKNVEILMNDKNLDISANATAYVLIKDLNELKQEIEKL